MADKRSCPACDSHTSGIAQAFLLGDDCPVCGFPADAARALDMARERGVSAELEQRVIDAEVRASKAEREVRRLTGVVSRVRGALSDQWDDV